MKKQKDDEMKHGCVFFAALALLPGAALAQSYDERAFDGFKVGVSVVRRSVDAKYDLPRLATKLDESEAGFGFRGHASYDVQIGRVLVFGVEGGIGRGGRSVSTRAKIGDYTLKPGWSWDLSGRMGLAPLPNLIVYGRAGRSWLRVGERTDFQDVKVPDLKLKNTESGFLWGAGIETALTAHVHARAEYNRANYRDGLTASKMQLGLSFGF